MSNIIVLLLLFVAVSNAISLKATLSSFTSQRDVAALTCPAYSCGSNGGACGLISPTSYVQCSTDSFCNYTSGSGVCYPNTNAGGFCATVGNDYCAAGTTCANSVCTTITFTATVGQTCGNAVQCAGFLDCSNGVCVTLPNKGNLCNATFECSTNLYCRSSNYICTPYFSISLGGDCDATNECMPGNACISRICTATLPSSNKQCLTSLDCNANENCGCAVSTKSINATCTSPMAFTQSQANSYTSLYQCIQDNTCTTTLEDCSNCKSSICSYYNQFVVGSVPAADFSCFGYSEFTTFCSSASFPAASLFFVLLVSLVALL